MQDDIQQLHKEVNLLRDKNCALEHQVSQSFYHLAILFAVSISISFFYSIKRTSAFVFTTNITKSLFIGILLNNQNEETG